jgi:hypothetical protein
MSPSFGLYGFAKPPLAPPLLGLVPWVGLVPSQFNFVNGQNFALTQNIAGPNSWPGGWLTDIAGSSLKTVTPNQLGPDGTLTASKLVEATGTGRFGVRTSNINLASHAGSEGTFFGVPLRIVLIAKAAERTRLVIEVLDVTVPGSNGNTTGDFIAVGVDLAGGNIGYDNSVVNWTIDAATMTQPFGGKFAGWWMITIDFRRTGPNNTNFSYDLRVKMDNGSGTAPSSSIYAGDNSSGLLLWFLSFLPKAAWTQLTSEKFRDDFTSLSTVDVNDTRAPGFNWYAHNNWPATSQAGSCWQITPPSTPSWFSQSGSLLTIADSFPGAQGGCGICLTSVAPDPSDPTKLIKGFTWRPPAIVECCFAFDPTLASLNGLGYSGGGGGHWHITPQIGIENPLTHGSEIDPDDGVQSGNFGASFGMSSSDQGNLVAGVASGAIGSSIFDFRQFALMIFNPSTDTTAKGFALMFWRIPTDNRIAHSLFSRDCVTIPWTSGNVVANAEYMSILTAGHMTRNSDLAEFPVPTAFDWYRIIK